MKYCIRLTNEKGKEVKLAGNEYIDIDVFDGNKRIVAFTMRPNGNYADERAAIFDKNDKEIVTSM